MMTKCIISVKPYVEALSSDLSGYMIEVRVALTSRRISGNAPNHESNS